jgi:hypothetical protein
MNSFLKACARCIMIGTALIAACLLSVYNLHADQQQPAINQLKEKPLVKKDHKIYDITFFSLKRGHSIAPATMILYDNGSLEIKLERDNLLTPQGKYTVADYLFEGDWEFTIKRTKPYQYASHFKGLYLFGTYIIGLFTLKEYIEDKRLTQEIPFVFFAALREKESAREKPKDSNQNSGASSQM